MLQIMIKIIVSLFLLMGAVWTLLPWNFGALNYAKTHNVFLATLAWLSWGLLLLAHLVLIYFVWFIGITYWWLMLLLLAHILFLVIFGRNVSTG